MNISKIDINLSPYKKILRNKFENETIGGCISYTTIPIVAGSIAGLGMISDKCKNFFKTISDNYFQLNTNPTTGEPYEPDVFQKTSANHLFLGDDVIVTAPTGTGKTAIAEYIMTKNLREGKRTFYTTPLKALSNEKFKDFQNIYGENLVGLLTGDTKINTKAPILIMTTEVYKNMATSAYFNKEKELPKDLKTVIFDELQYLGDVDRGGVWETSIMLTPPNVQMLSLSATAKNADKINEWIGKIRGQKSFRTNTDGNYHTNPSNQPRCIWIDVPPSNRHVPLDIKLEHVTPDGNKKAVKTKKQNSEDFKKSLGAKTNLSTYKLITKKLNQERKLPAIYFIFSKKDSRELLKYFEEFGDKLTTSEEEQEIKEIIESYKSNNIYLGESLNINALQKGYATHNAGMLPSQKELVEKLFQKKLLKIAIATETLSAGINMPAKTTIISSIRKPASISDSLHDGKRNLTPNEFHQMAGRAGRRGIDKNGYCYPLSCNKAQTTIIEELMASPSNNITSNFKFDYAFVANYLAKHESLEEIRNFISKTFYSQGNEHKTNYLVKEFKLKRDILYNDNFIDKNGLTLKGQLIRHINGYEQIPVINFISDKKLSNLTVEELSGIIGGMANIEYKDALRTKEKIFTIESDSENLKDKSEELNDTIMSYQDKVSSINPEIKMEVNTEIINHLYEWAKLNSENYNSTKNWKELYTGKLKDTIRDEGTLFKEITMTIDLMKQMITICDTGKELSLNIEDKKYYSELKDKLYKAIDLIQQEPIDYN